LEPITEMGHLVYLINLLKYSLQKTIWYWWKKMVSPNDNELFYNSNKKDYQLNWLCKWSDHKS